MHLQRLRCNRDPDGMLLPSAVGDVKYIFCMPIISASYRIEYVMIRFPARRVISVRKLTR
jgi:hypothetical protein